MNTFTKKGYQFAGWATTAKGTVEYKNKASVNNLATKNGATVTLYAKWTPVQYTIRYNKNGATGGSMKDTACKYGTKYNLPANTFTKTGYKFAGWATTAKGSVKYKNKASVNNLTSKNGTTITLYAKWTPIQYTIRYNKNGGTGKSMKDTASCQYGKNYTLRANTYTRKGYQFAGWSTTPNGSVKYKNKASIKNLTTKNGATVTLYAKWKKK